MRVCALVASLGLVGCSALTDFEGYRFGGDGSVMDASEPDAFVPPSDQDGDGFDDPTEARCGTDPDDADSSPDPAAMAGSGTAEDPYEICLVQHLALLAADESLLGGDFRLLGDLDGPAELRPAGELSGDLDGGGFTIHDVSIAEPASDEVALFRRVSATGSVHDLTLEGWTVRGTGTVGLLAATSEGPIERVHVVDGEVQATHHAGLLVGQSNGAVRDCTSAGTITAQAHVGGLVGGASGVVERSSSSARVAGVNRTGGLIGSATAITVSECASTGRVSGSFSIGGLVGTLFSGEVVDSYSRAEGVDVEPMADDSLSGGLVGEAAAMAEATIVRAYASCEVLLSPPGPAPAEGLVGGVGMSVLTVSGSYFNADRTPTGTRGEAASDAEMMNAATFDGWDFEDTWVLDPALSPYPSLQWER